MEFNLKIAKYLRIYLLSSPQPPDTLSISKLNLEENGSFIFLYLDFGEIFVTELKSYEAKNYVPGSRVRDQ